MHQDAIISIAIESWRFARAFDGLLIKLDADEQKRYSSQLLWFMKKLKESLEEVGLRIVDVEGQSFNPGMAATPLNIEDFDPGDCLIVDRMLEPIIMGKEGLVKTGTVILRRAE